MKQYLQQKTHVYSNGGLAIQQHNMYDLISTAGRDLLKRGKEVMQGGLESIARTAEGIFGNITYGIDLGPQIMYKGGKQGRRDKARDKPGWEDGSKKKKGNKK